SGEELKVEGIIPHVIEPSLGLDRAFLAFLMDAYEEDELGNDKRTVLKLHPKLAPVKIAVFPLMANKENLVKKAKEVYEKLWTIDYGLSTVSWDDIGNVGKRYRRQDEIGTPWCVTVDYQTLEDNTVTIRDRDIGKQIRHPISELEKYFCDRI
ncbi:MAG: His/Gly/Thr/Pro-type tRNA ligase C-terminal domain-containing protein, partial [Patescibacteria group bacterium]